MAVRRYVANADTTITNAYETNLVTRGTGSNMGASDVSEVFTVYGQAASGSLEAARILTKFSISDISTDRSASNIPASGSVNFYLRLYNARHGQTLPRDYNLLVQAVSRTWEEGAGLDMEGYSDLTHNSVGANWEKSAAATSWTTEGGDFYNDASSSFTASFDSGVEDMELDITTLVEQWLGGAANEAVLGSKTNYGVGIKFPDTSESATRSYYTKQFYARGTEFFFKRPVIEARWDSSKKDSAGSFYLSSSVARAADNLNKIYLYNNVRGQLRNIPAIGTGDILVSVYSGSTAPAGNKLGLAAGGGVASAADNNVTGSYVSTGIYSASFAYTSSAITKIFPVWHSSSTEYHTGSGITVNTFDSSDYNPSPTYVTAITNLKERYSREEEARFRLYVRPKDWNPTIYTKAKADPDNVIIEDAYYKIIRTVDDLDVVKYGSGSLSHTRLSYDVSGNYFDLPITLLEKDYMYGIKLTYKLPNGLYREQPHIFKFRVE